MQFKRCLRSNLQPNLGIIAITAFFTTLFLFRSVFRRERTSGNLSHPGPMENASQIEERQERLAEAMEQLTETIEQLDVMQTDEPYDRTAQQDSVEPHWRALQMTVGLLALSIASITFLLGSTERSLITLILSGLIIFMGLSSVVRALMLFMDAQGLSLLDSFRDDSL